MATKRRSKLEQERMTDANLQRVIALLEPKSAETKPISKKDACQILGMAYNTTRLAQIIDDFKQAQARDKVRRAEKRGKPATTEETQYIISEYLKGETVDSISKSTYRGPQFVKNILEQHAVPQRSTSWNYFKPELIPDNACKSRFAVGETVYSARYDSLAKVILEQPHSQHSWVYRIWLLADNWQQFAYQPVDELASLEHLKVLGIRV
jgi:hypothetical protein